MKEYSFLKNVNDMNSLRLSEPDEFSKFFGKGILVYADGRVRDKIKSYQLIDFCVAVAKEYKKRTTPND